MLKSLVITPAMLRLITELDEFKGAWKAYKNIAPERLDALRKVATIESVGSSTRIEGSHLSDREVEILLSGLDNTSFASRDEEEVAGYAIVMEEVFQSWKSISFTENHIQQLHSMLLQYSGKDVRHRGKYKTLSNSVEAFAPDGSSLGVIFQTASPFDTPLRMENLVRWAQQALAEKEMHPLLIIGAFVVDFLAIHPFQDGNGRLSRVLTALLLLQSGYNYVPYSSLESVIEESKQQYYLALRRTQATLQSDEPDFEPWILYFLKAMQKQKQRLEAKLKRENILRSELPELSVSILELAKERGQVSTGEIEALTKANRSTIKAHISSLVKSKHLVRHGKGRGTWYTLDIAR